MVKVSGDAAHKRRLAKLRGPEMLEGVTQALYLGAQDIVIDAQLSMTEGAVSGKHHQPSAPGQPPKADTHVLANSGESAIVEPLKVEASFNAPYAAAQEMGSSVLPERPYMRPAAKRGRPRVLERVRVAVNQALASSG